MKNTEFNFLTSILYLKNEMSKCDEYDGWTKEDQTEYYIKQNGFDPIKKYEEQIDLFKKEYIFVSSLSLDYSSSKLERIQQFGKEIEEAFKEHPFKNLILQIYLNIYCDNRL